MKILVTGAAGYIGSVLIPLLLQEGHEVIAIDNFMYNQSSLLDCCVNPNFDIVNGDARDKSLVAEKLKKVDAVFPLACYTGAPLCSKDPFGAQTINFDSIKDILDLRSKQQIIIFPTTNSGYGIGEENNFCTEESPLNPISLYGKLKVEIERILLESENCLTMRFATLFGASPRMRLDLLVNDFVYRAINDRFIVLFESHFKRNYLHVRDASRAFLHCLNNFDDMKEQAYNVGLSDSNLSKWELCEKIKSEIPGFYFIEGKVGEDVDKRNYIVSNDKIEASGFKPKYSLQFGIAELKKVFQVINKNLYSNV